MKLISLFFLLLPAESLSFFQNSNAEMVLCGSGPVEEYSVTARISVEISSQIRTWTRLPRVKTAEDCSDNSHNCSDWAKVGECDANPNYMLQQVVFHTLLILNNRRFQRIIRKF